MGIQLATLERLKEQAFAQDILAFATDRYDVATTKGWKVIVHHVSLWGRFSCEKSKLVCSLSTASHSPSRLLFGREVNGYARFSVPLKVAGRGERYKQYRF
jgi:hypothetical protein